jgi:hypothetical protein
MKKAASLSECISESAFRKQVIDLGRLLGWRIAAIRPVRVQRRNGETYFETPMEADGVGWPDLFMVHTYSLWPPVALELKRIGGRPTPEQLAWIGDMNRAGIDARVVTPDDWNAIVSLLKGES